MFCALFFFLGGGVVGEVDTVCNSLYVGTFVKSTSVENAFKKLFALDDNENAVSFQTARNIWSLK